MKYHVQFLVLNTRGVLDEACGSDGVFILDGRNSLQTMVRDAINRFNQMNNFRDSFVGWEIKKGDRFTNSVTIKKWVKPEVN